MNNSGYLIGVMNINEKFIFHIVKLNSSQYLRFILDIVIKQK